MSAEWQRQSDRLKRNAWSDKSEYAENVSLCDLCGLCGSKSSILCGKNFPIFLIFSSWNFPLLIADNRSPKIVQNQV